MYVDDEDRATVDLYAGSPLHRRLVYRARWAVSGSHTLRIVVVGTPGRPRVGVDAFVVLR